MSCRYTHFSSPLMIPRIFSSRLWSWIHIDRVKDIKYLLRRIELTPGALRLVTVFRVSILWHWRTDYHYDWELCGPPTLVLCRKERQEGGVAGKERRSRRTVAGAGRMGRKRAETVLDITSAPVLDEWRRRRGRGSGCEGCAHPATSHGTAHRPNDKSSNIPLGNADTSAEC
jgi:hypothetical protein